MANANSTTSDDISRLRETVTHMDALSQKTFDEIVAISRLANEALKADPDARARFNHVIIALGAMESRAEDTMNDINATAEQVGCNYKAARQEVTA